jgi:hydrogenase/urease accessory protein HupE
MRFSFAFAGLATAICVFAMPRTAAAHSQPYSYLDLRLEDRAFGGRVAAHVIDIAHEAGLPAPDSLLDSSFVRKHLSVIERVFAERLGLSADGRAVAPRWTHLEIDDDRNLVALEWTAKARPSRLEICGPMFRWEAVHETYLNVYEGGQLRRQDLLDATHLVTRYDSGARQSVISVIRKFVGAGIHHIFIGPDHILFIVGLLLLGGGVGRLLKIVTAFTVAHSITLGLATFQILDPSPRIIEPAIALSIVFVGADNLWSRGRRMDPRALLAFGFGFVHGFGFASVLRDFGLPRESLGWSLFSFNAGVEIGQACIVLSVVPLLGWLRSRNARAAQTVVIFGSWCVILAGSYWFAERVLAH